MSTGTKKGYITLEAAIILPIFIIAIVTIGFTMKIIHYQETAVFVTGNSVASLMQNLVVMPVHPEAIDEIERNVEEALPEIEEANVEKFISKHCIDGIDNIVSFDITIRSKTGLPGNMTGRYKTRHAFVFRIFCGKDNSKVVYNDNLIIEDEDALVYVFPNRGEKYHKRSCTQVTPHPLQMTMNDEIRRKYDACVNCDSKLAENGSIIYVFEYGGAYHMGDCSSVDKYVVTMTKMDAVKRGYTACQTCGGSL